MFKFEFGEDDLFVNRLKTYPEYNVFIYQSRQYINKDKIVRSNGGLVVYDINRNLEEGVTPFISASAGNKLDFRNRMQQPIIKTATQDSLSVTQNVINTPNAAQLASLKRFYAGQTGQIGSVYPYSVPITRKLTTAANQFEMLFWDIGAPSNSSQATVFVSALNNYPHAVLNNSASALQNYAKKYLRFSKHFDFNSMGDGSEAHGLGRNLLTSTINMVDIPRMYYGNSIKKGSVNLRYYVTGSKVAECCDKNQNGELIEITGSGAGSVVGIVMYDEGIIMLTGSHNLSANAFEFTPGVASQPTWMNYGTTLNDGVVPSPTLASASYGLDFKGTSFVSTMTMFAHAEKGNLNHSNNPTYKNVLDTSNSTTGSGNLYYEGSQKIKNIVSSSTHTGARFDKVTYISKIRLYDENNNLIGIATLANPVKKTEDKEYTFKLKLDI